MIVQKKNNNIIKFPIVYLLTKNLHTKKTSLTSKYLMNLKIKKKKKCKNKSLVLNFFKISQLNIFV